ncbi:MAG: 50S ribosomal protein L9 [Parcubacteria group bacterium GW2011_GWA2_43_11]|nr:MAG: 50S ribosomal protein L9 [Parcubacteria group bacterium GW2011_GWC2_42_11]KKS85394.1 MAG: 50S ribosomal protein L9 [Parcubacteria group bacterium GW2011_GWA2_43_11]
MQVILTKDVARVGRRYEVVDVSSGYANNFLYPQKLAEPATPAKILLLEKKREKNQEEERIRNEELALKFKNLEGTTLTITVKSDEQGNLYKKINSGDIASALLSDHAITLPETAIFLESPIDKTGDHEVTVEHGDNKATITIQVVRE